MYLCSFDKSADAVCGSKDAAYEYISIVSNRLHAVMQLPTTSQQQACRKAQAAKSLSATDAAPLRRLESCACRDDSTVASSAQREREAAADNSGSGDEAQVSHTPVPSVFLCMRDQVRMPLHSISDRTGT